MEFTGIHPATAQLAIELQLADIRTILGRPGEKDEYAAFECFRTGLQGALSLFQDQLFAVDLLSGDHNTRVVFDTLVQEERQAAQDHRLACEISGMNHGQPQIPEHIPIHDAKDQSLWVREDGQTSLRTLVKDRTCDRLVTTEEGFKDCLTNQYPGRIDAVAGKIRDNKAESSTGSRSKGKRAATKTGHEEEHTTHTMCSVCLEQCPRFDALELDCKRPEDIAYHAYCRDCLTDLFQTSLTDTTLFPPKCCRVRIPIEICLDFLPPRLIQLYREKELELAAPNPVYCSNRYCTKFISCELIVADVATCRGCGDQTCSVCKNPRHNGLCPEDQTVQVLMEMAGKKRWQRCPRCRTLVELLVGCYHMRCRCGGEFCYLCAKPWKTCQCSQWDENRLLSNDRVVDGPETHIAMPEEQEVLEADPSLDVLNDLELRIATVVGGFAILNDENDEEQNPDGQLDGCTHRWSRVYGGQGELETCGICLHHLRFVNVCTLCRTKVCTRCLHNRM